MQFDRTDIFLLTLPFLQLQVLIQLFVHLGYDVLRSASSFASLPAVSLAIVFLLGTMSVLLGIQKTINAYFDATEHRNHHAKGAGYALLLSLFMLITLIAITRTYA